MVDIRVLTYNIHWGIGMDGRLDLRRVADVIRRLDPDLVGLQEIDRNRRTETEYEDQLAILTDSLDMEYAYGVTIEREPNERSDGEPRQYGIAVLSPHRIVESRNHHLTRFESAEQRTLLETHVAVDGTTVPFFNTHLGLRSEERIAQVEDVLEFTSDAGTHVLVGDFNARPDSRPVQMLVSRYDDVFARHESGETPTFPSPYVNSGEGTEYVEDSVEVYVPNRRIDYVFGTPDVEPRDAGVRHSLASDHSPVFADLTIRDEHATTQWSSTSAVGPQ